MVDGDDTDTSLLEELNVSTGNVTWLSVFSFSDMLLKLILGVEHITTERFSEDADDGSLLMVDDLGVTLSFLHRDHIVFLGPINPSFSEVGSARKERMLNGDNFIEHTSSGE